MSVATSAAHADVDPLPRDFSYVQAQFPGASVPSDVLARFSGILEGEGYSVLDGTNAGNIPFFGVDQVYSDALNSRAVFIKFDLEPSSPQLMGELRSVRNGPLVFHSKRRFGVQYAIIFHGSDTVHARRVVSLVQAALRPPMKRDQTAPGAFLDRFSLIPAAHANATCTLSPWETMRLASLSRVNQKVSAGTATDTLSGCAAGVLKGAWASTGGVAAGAASATSDFMKDPLGSLQKLGVKMNQLWSFVSHLPEQLKKAWAGFSELDQASQIDIGCEFLGSLGTDLAIGILTAGVGSAKWALFAARLETYAARLTRLNGFVRHLAKSTDLSVQQVRRKIFRRLSGDMDEDLLAATAEFSDRGLMDVAIGAAACGI